MNSSNVSKRYYRRLRKTLSPVVEHADCDNEALAVALIALAIDVEEFRGAEPRETARLLEQLGDHLRTEAEEIRH